MEYIPYLFKVDEAGRITHRAVNVPGDHARMEWCPLSPDEVAGEGGTAWLARDKIHMFHIWGGWKTPNQPTGDQHIDFDNVRQILNPYGNGTHTCSCGGAARLFIEAMLEFPRFVTPGGKIELGGADYLTASKTAGCDHNAGRGKRGAGRTKGSAAVETKDAFGCDAWFGEDGKFDNNAFFADGERREFGFKQKVAAFNAYVDWIGKHAGCGGAAQGVVIAVDRLVAELRWQGIDGFDDIDRACGAVQDALAELCRALGDAETAAGANVKAPAGDPPRAVAGLSQQQFDDLKGIANETQAGVNLAVKQIKGIAGAAKDMRETADDLKRTQEDAAETITDVAGELSKKMDAGMGAIGKVAGAVGKMGANVEAGRVAAERAAERADEARVRAGRAERNTRAIADVLASGWDGFLAALRKAGYKPKKQLPERAKSGIVKLWDQFKAEQYDAIIAYRFDIDKREINHHSYDAFIEYCANMVVYKATPDGTNTTEYRLGEIIEQTDDVKKIVHTRDVQKSRAKKEREKGDGTVTPGTKEQGQGTKNKIKTASMTP